MPSVKVLSTDIIVRAVPSKVEGKPDMIFRTQRVALDQGGGYSLPFHVDLGRTNPAYPVGDHLIDPACFTLDLYGNLKLDRVRLIAVKSAAQPAKV